VVLLEIYCTYSILVKNVVIKKLNKNSIGSDENIQHEIKMQNKTHTCENVIRFLGITQGT